MKIHVFTEKDKVILDLGGRRTDMLISCDAALKVAEAIETQADFAEKEPKSLIKGEVWDLRVESFDGQVGFKIIPPYQLVGSPSRIPIPVNAARSIARLIRDKESWARHKMRLVIQKG